MTSADDIPGFYAPVHRALAEPILQHRMALTFAARAEGMSVGTVIAGLVDALE